MLLVGDPRRNSQFFVELDRIAHNRFMEGSSRRARRLRQVDAIHRQLSPDQLFDVYIESCPPSTQNLITVKWDSIVGNYILDEQSEGMLSDNFSRSDFNRVVALLKASKFYKISNFITEEDSNK